jgi:hypothetical protein
MCHRCTCSSDAFQTSRVSLEHEFASLHGLLKKGAARALSFRRLFRRIPQKPKIGFHAKMLTRVFGLLVAVATASPSVDVVYRAGATECGPEDLIKNQTTVSIHYTVTMPHIDSGRVIDSTREEVPGGRGQPLTLVVGLRLVLPGLDQGLIGLCKGAQVDLTVPPELAYGEKGLREQTRDPATGNLTAYEGGEWTL